MGFENVYDYAPGKADWGSYGLPLEGNRASGTRVGALARTDVPTCSLDESLPDVCRRVSEAGWDTCFVLDAHGVVLGRLGRAALGRDGDVTIEEAMTLGPSTVRPSYELDKALARMDAQQLTSLPVTHSNGVLVGVILREDLERALT